jgi:hypothetical protein
MASIIKIKRSTGTALPTSLSWGELAYITGIGSYSGSVGYRDRIYIADDGLNVIPVGGYYYTSMMEHAPGAIAGVTNSRNFDNGVVAVLAPATNTSDSTTSLKVDQWNVDNLRLDSNTLSSTNINGNIILDPAGIGSVIIPDDTYLNFGDDKNVAMRYDETTDDRFEIEGADWYFENGVAIKIGDTTQSDNKDTGALVVEGGVGIEKNLFVGGSIGVSGISTFDDIKIENNVISTLPGTTEIYIDPYPDGLSNEGTVIIKGNLQVDGNTTSINSSTVDVNDPIIILGDVTSKRTVMTPVITGVSTIRLDSVVGINTDDVISGSTSLSPSGVGTVTSVDSPNKIITLSQAVISGISTTTQLTVTHAYDTNTDRGIGFNYNTSSGLLNNKTGFFGYIDGTNVGSAATPRSWTYIPDATITNSVVTGTRGYLDIKGIYYQSGDFNTHGVVYFDVDGLQTSTNNPSSSTITSKQVLVAITKVVLTLPSSIVVNTGDFIKQDSSNAYGIVETGGTLSSVSLIGVEGTFNTSNNLRREGNNGQIQNLSIVPSSTNIIYTNRPTWTATLDGGNY